MIQKPRPRKQRFMFKEYSENTIRFDITNQSDTKLLGTEFGKLILQSFIDECPVKGVYTFGRIGMGKTVFSTAIINSFNNIEDLLIDVKHKVRYRFYDTYPKCHHLDYYDFLRPDFEYKNKIDLKPDEIIIAEWSEYIPKRPIDWFEPDKIEIELYHCFDKKSICTERKSDILNFNTITSEGSMRFASMIGYGNGIKIIQKLKEINSIQHLIVNPSEL